MLRNVLTACLGREDLLTEVGGLLRSSPWTTLTGPPGSGKSLVARHAVAGHGDVVWVEGPGETSVEGVVEAMLAGLGGEPAPGLTPVEAVAAAVNGREPVLVLDGVDDPDGALRGLGAFLEQLVVAAPGLRVLCTAAARAGRPAERVVRVGGLPVPGPGEELDGPALELFLRTVELAGGHPVALPQQDAEVRALLTASGGLPGLLEQLGSHIALMGMGGVLPSGRLHQAIRVSYDLLSEDERTCFRQIAALDRPVPVSLLASLLDVEPERAGELAASLARRSLLESTPEGRLRMLEPMRSVGRGLSGADDARAGALLGVLAWGEQVTPTDYESGASDVAWLPDVAVLRQAVEHAATDDVTRPRAYALANRMFGSLYTSLRTREAVDMLESVLAAGDGPPELGAQVARRAGICASESRGTYAGLAFLDRAEEHSVGAADVERARTASIRAEMHLDAGALAEARVHAERALELGASDPHSAKQARRTLMDVAVSSGAFAAAREHGRVLMADPDPGTVWVGMAAQVLTGRIALEQGRSHEAAALGRSARQRAEQAHEDRIALIARTLVRQADPGPVVAEPDLETLPWAVRLAVQVQQAREVLAGGDLTTAARLAADAVVVADAAQLGRDGVDARLLLAAALVDDDPGQARRTLADVLRRAAAMPLPLRVADALDGLAAVLHRESGDGTGPTSARVRQLTGAARALRAPRDAVGMLDPHLRPPSGSSRDCPAGWVVAGQLTPAGVTAALQVGIGEDARRSPIEDLTRAERAVAELVAEGHTTRQIAARLFVSPRTVDSHLASTYRKLGISGRARLAALMVERG